jgi:hypothetical protein
MSEIDLSSNSGFLPIGKLVLQLSPWQNLQKYLTGAINAQPSPNMQAQVILKELHATAEDFKSDVLPNANELGNTLYNYGGTASATLQGVSSVMGLPKPDKDALLALFGNLKDSATKAKGGVETVMSGLARFNNAAVSGGKALAELLESAKQTIARTNGTLQTTAKDLHQQLSAANLDVAEVEADIQNIQQAAGQLAEVKLAGLTFPVAAGAEASMAAAADLDALAGAWDALVTQLTQVLDTLANSTADDLKQEPWLSEFQLARAEKSWQDIAAQAHDFMMNFYVTPQ